MRAITIIVILAGVAGLSAPATASQYTVGFFADEAPSSCEIYNVESEVITIHMILYGEAETANTVGFYAPTPECWDAVWLGDEITDGLLFLGDSHSTYYGLTVTFVGCRELPVRLGSMSFWAHGSEPCCTYKAYELPHFDRGFVEVVTCDTHEIVPATHESVIINPDNSCGCTASNVVSAEPSTWGRVKALYQ